MPIAWLKANTLQTDLLVRHPPVAGRHEAPFHGGFNRLGPLGLEPANQLPSLEFHLPLRDGAQLKWPLSFADSYGYSLHSSV
jgi:hypothetical protein